jgi:two-component system response regulator FixJ
MARSPIIYVVDDDEAVRDSLQALFEAEGFEVAVFASGRAFLSGGEAPADGCLVTDVRMPDMNGLELLAALSERAEAPAVIMITGHGDVPMAVRAMKLGAADFIEKPFDADLLLARVRDVLGAAKRQRAEPHAASDTARRVESLTPREREVLEQLVIGRSNKAIGLELKISPRTVEIHRARVMEKMAATNLSQLVRLALAAGIDPHPIGRDPYKQST